MNNTCLGKTILLTGATGYLGSRLGLRLLECGCNLVCICRNKERYFICDKKYQNSVKNVFLDESSLEEVFKNNKIDIVIHTATSYGRRGEVPTEILKTNVEFPLSILSLAIENNVEAFINTDTILVKNISNYALAKSQFAEWLSMFSDKIKVINLKLDHFYGPNDKPVKFVAWVIEQLKNNVEKIDLTEGSQTRDFIYIDDVVDVYTCVIENLDKIPVGKKNDYEVGTGNKISIKTFIKTLKELMKNSVTELNFGAVPYRKNEVLDYDVDITALKALGWSPKYSIEEGIQDIINKEGLV